MKVIFPYPTEESPLIGVDAYWENASRRIHLMDLGREVRLQDVMSEPFQRKVLQAIGHHIEVPRKWEWTLYCTDGRIWRHRNGQVEELSLTSQRLHVAFIAKYLAAFH